MTARAARSDQLAATRVMAILRARSADRLEAVAATLADAGVTCLELTLTSPGALDALGRLRDRLPATVEVGAGTVTTAGEASAAIDAGAQFVVSPAVCPDVVTAATAAGAGAYPGAWTPTEVLAAWSCGASAVKIFPAAVAGPAYLRHLAGPLPHVPVVPTGGVRIEDIGAYLDAGALAVGLGGPLIGDALDGGPLTDLRARARAALDAARRATEAGG